MADILTKEDLLGKLRSYVATPDDENVRYKDIVKNTLLRCPELLYALHEKELETELFDSDGNINWDKDTHEPLGEWDRYFGENANIKPYLLIPETQDTKKHYLCYQTLLEKASRYSDQKYIQVKFVIIIDGRDAIDKTTGIARHDLISSILREKFNLRNTFGLQSEMVSNQETFSDNNYIIRTVIFEAAYIKGVATTPYNGKTTVNSYQLRK